MHKFHTGHYLERYPTIPSAFLFQRFSSYYIRQMSEQNYDAANELFVTQPAISLAIKELETEFGIVLFNRQNNKLTLTTDGELFYEKAIYILQYCNEMQYEMDTHGKQDVHSASAYRPF